MKGPPSICTLKHHNLYIMRFFMWQSEFVGWYHEAQHCDCTRNPMFIESSGMRLFTNCISELLCTSTCIGCLHVQLSPTMCNEKFLRPHWSHVAFVFIYRAFFVWNIEKTTTQEAQKKKTRPKQPNTVVYVYRLESHRLHEIKIHFIIE